jgi:protein tyrosine phosphatase (PTP) superfamily phosphohydrolase (DUF442 family)
MPQWAIENQLARGARPGYGGERGQLVTKAAVDAWIAEVKAFGVKSIICLLADDQLCLYQTLPSGLIPYYEQRGLAVAAVPARDHEWPPLTDAQLVAVWEAYQRLPKPVLIHCSAGIDRTGRAVDYILSRIRHDQRPSVKNPSRG